MADEQSTAPDPQPQEGLPGDLGAFISEYLAAATPILERVMVFIDAGYLDRCAREHFGGGRLDYTKFSRKVTAGKRLIRTYYYDGRIENPPSDYWKGRQRRQQSLAAALARQPSLEIRWGKLQFGEDGSARQKGVDVLISLDMLLIAHKNNYDTAVLVSGDGDFADIVRMLKDEGRKVTLVTHLLHSAFSLEEAADDVYDLAHLGLEDCWVAQREDAAPAEDEKAEPAEDAEPC